MDSTNGLACLYLPDYETVKALNGYKMLLVSLINKKVVSLTNIGGHTNYLSSSSLEEIILKNEICSMINSMIVKLPCFNVYAGIIFSSLLIKLWSEPLLEYGVFEITKTLTKFKAILQETLNSLKYKYNNVLDVFSLQCALESILFQEPALLLSKESLKKLSFEIVKAVLGGVNTDDGFKVGRFHVHVKDGSEYFLVINGVICEVDDTTVSLIKRVGSELGLWNKMLLFAENIYDSERFVAIIKILLENDIKLVMCQKKVSELLKVMLRRNNVVTVERIGLEAAKSIEQLTGCIPICNMDTLKNGDVLSKAGYYSTFCLQRLNGLNYIVLEKKGYNVSTLYVSCRSFSSSYYTRKLCSDSIKFVCSMITSPYILPGPIFFEEKLIRYLKDRVVDSEIMSRVILIFCNILNEIIYLFKGLKLNNGTSDNKEESWEIYDLKKNAFMYCIDGVINCLSIGMIVRK